MTTLSSFLPPITEELLGDSTGKNGLESAFSFIGSYLRALVVDGWLESAIHITN